MVAKIEPLEAQELPQGKELLTEVVVPKSLMEPFALDFAREATVCPAS